jgi:hypothetical protein
VRISPLLATEGEGEVSEQSPGPINAPPGEWLVRPPDRGEWLIAVAIPSDVEIPERLSDAVDRLLEALDVDPGSVSGVECKVNQCTGNNDCGHQCGYKRHG